MWSATVGATPVNRWTWAASATFSYGSRGTPFWAKTLKRVPELPNAQEGSSMRCDRSAATTAWLVVTSASVAHRGGCPRGRAPLASAVVPIIRVRLDRTRRRRLVSDPGGAAEEGAPEELAPGDGAARIGCGTA